MQIFKKIKKQIKRRLITVALTLDKHQIDKLFLAQDKKIIFRTNTIQDIPLLKDRTGGKNSYGEWAHVIGIFQSVLYWYLPKHTGNRILDVGCGTGLMSMVAQNYINDNGEYIGLDINEKEIDFCRQHYNKPNLSFVHHHSNNAFYTKDKDFVNNPWSFNDGMFNLVTALSVWTHLNEKDAVFFMKEVSRVLSNGGLVIITVFLLDEAYNEGLGVRKKIKGKYHNTLQTDWVFDKEAYGSKNWRFPGHLDIPEKAIGVTIKGLEILLKESGLKLKKHHMGNWKEVPGLFFQDILVLQKCS